jgi:hypothetical protein
MADDDLREDEFEVQSPQDDLTTDAGGDNDTKDVADPFADESGDDPTETLGVDPEEYAKGLDDIDMDEAGHRTSDDWAEEIEDRDDDATSREDDSNA